MTVGRDLVRWVKSVEMADVAVLVARIVGIDKPFLQLTIAPDLHRRKLGEGRSKR